MVLGTPGNRATHMSSSELRISVMASSVLFTRASSLSVAHHAQRALT